MKKSALIFIWLMISTFLIKGQSEDFSIGKIEFSGNNKTKEYIILRELMFKEGEKYNWEEFAKLKKSSEENLMNTSLFHKANISTSDKIGDSVNIKITVVERWYLWPIPQVDIDERNFNVWWEKKSLDRLSGGIFLTKENFRGRMENLTIILMAGYNQQYGISYMAPYINKSKTLGVGADIIWSGKHEVNNITRDDKQIFYKDVNQYVRKELSIGFNLQYRKNFYNTHFLQFNYQNFNLSQGLLDSSKNYSWKDQTSLPFFGLYYKLKIDHRNFKTYPLKGYYIDLEIFKYGLGILDNKNLNLWDLKTTVRKYWEIRKNLYFAGGFIGKLSNYKGHPFLLQKSLGYGRDFVRGYEYYVVDGQHYGVAKANLKYAIFSQRTSKIDFIKTNKFNTIPWAVYVNLFADAGLVTRNTDENISNILPGKTLHSVGLGIDLSTYYDRVVRFELALNGFGEYGFYLHFIAPI